MGEDRKQPENWQNGAIDPKQTQAISQSLLSVNRPDRAAYTNTAISGPFKSFI
jgi:hypothetical protein